MYKLLIIDDEPLMREGMKCILPWEELGFSVCGECDNGDSALADILAKKPDLAIIDMKMPGRQGISVIDEARRKGFDGHFIILTGFSNFSYAQSAIRLDVDEYLLKPIDEEELECAVRKVTARIKQKPGGTSTDDLLLRTLSGLLHGDLLSQAELESLSLWTDRYRVAALWSPALSPEELLLRLPKPEKGMHTLLLDRMAVLLAAGRPAAEKLSGALENMLRSVPQAFAAIGREATSPREIPRSFQDSIDLLEKRFFWNGAQTMNRELFRQSHPEDLLMPPDPETYAQAIASSIQASNTKRICALMDELESRFDPETLSAEASRGLLISVYAKLKEKLLSCCPGIREDLPEEETVIRTLFEKNFLYECTIFLTDCFCGICAHLNSSPAENVLNKIQAYIQRNYTEDLKLEKLADIFGYNSAYLGKLFKTGTGESFNQYLDWVRIEKAKEYLAQNELLVYQISERLGYKNINYFYMKFKKITGLSPREYVTAMPAKEQNPENLPE